MASDRRGLWRLCACGARGALAAARWSELPDGRFAFARKRPLPNGRTRLVLTGVELLKKLVPLIPPVYANLTRFHGVFAPTSRLRAKVVPPPVESPPTQCPPTGPAPLPSPSPVTRPSPAPSPKPSPTRSAYRLDGAALLKRVFAVDVMLCSRCDGPMKVIAFLEEPTVVKGILTHLGLPAEPLPAVHAQAPPTTVEMLEDPLKQRSPGCHRSSPVDAVTFDGRRFASHGLRRVGAPCPERFGGAKRRRCGGGSAESALVPPIRFSVVTSNVRQSQGRLPEWQTIATVTHDGDQLLQHADVATLVSRIAPGASDVADVVLGGITWEVRVTLQGGINGMVSVYLKACPGVVSLGEDARKAIIWLLKSK
jgi:hypothetical protein